MININENIFKETNKDYEQSSDLNLHIFSESSDLDLSLNNETINLIKFLNSL